MLVLIEACFIYCFLIWNYFKTVAFTTRLLFVYGPLYFALYTIQGSSSVFQYLRHYGNVILPSDTYSNRENALSSQYTPLVSENKSFEDIKHKYYRSNIKIQRTRVH